MWYVGLRCQEISPSSMDPGEVGMRITSNIKSTKHGPFTIFMLAAKLRTYEFLTAQRTSRNTTGR